MGAARALHLSLMTRRLAAISLSMMQSLKSSFLENLAMSASDLERSATRNVFLYLYSLSLFLKGANSRIKHLAVHPERLEALVIEEVVSRGAPLFQKLLVHGKGLAFGEPELGRNLPRCSIHLVLSSFPLRLGPKRESSETPIRTWRGTAAPG